LLYIALNGLVFGLLGTQNPAGKSAQTLPGSWAKVRHNVVKCLGQRLVYGLIFGIGLGSLYGWLSGLIFGQFIPADSLLIFRLSVGLYSGLLNAINFGFIGKLNPEIRPAEVFIWSWGNWRRNFSRFLGYGLLLGFVFGLMIAPPLGLIIGLSVGLPLGLFFGSFYSFMGGLASGLQDERNLTRPNQGIRRSARNSVRVGLISALASGLLAGTVFGLLVWLLAGPTNGLMTGITTGITTLISVGTIVGLRGGGIACIQHVLLRWHLWRAGSMPWNYPHFLDHAAERILLRKVGGGYIFVHRLLLEYFASLGEEESS